jgi:hypothetical protein
LGRITKPKPGFRINPLHPLSRGLVGWWLFNEGGGPTAFDYSTSNKNGTLTNGVIYRGSTFGGSVVFDGVDSYINLGTPIVTTYPFTLSAWFLSFGSTGASQGIIAIADATGVNRHLINLSSANPPLLTAQSQVFPTIGSISDGIVEFNSFTHACAVFASATSRTLYKNGINVGTDTTSVSPTGLTDTLFGLRLISGSEAPLNGFIDDIRVYNRALNDIEVQGLYRSPYANVISPKAYTTFFANGGSGPTPGHSYQHHGYGLGITGHKRSWAA